MLEIRNLVKTYSTKGGVTVRALDDVTVNFPETGMVFLLGRSGSGKSTLLNVSGGLDKPDSGEIIVKGRSSKDFSESDFDSYRNTYVGFIFQEYNILNEFSVEQNIALALQLQNKPNDKKAVEDLLEQVDLKGLGKRKPNTLSGGQKQRVAIARALIKEPEIIMADEPTGALDSNTGKQVLETLKKLSKTKLVVVVSHDREFAKHYGDRVIELADGKIISDVTKDKAKPEKITDNIQMISEDTISIKNTEKVTESEVKSILSILRKKKGEAIITSGSETLGEIKKVCKVDEEGNREYFKQTEEVKVKDYDGKQTKFIKSRLPLRHALKMGASGLKTKPIRLLFTILLSVVAFTMFGVSSTLMLYDSSYSVSKALQEANNSTVTLTKEYNFIYQGLKWDTETGEGEIDYEYEAKDKTLFGVSELSNKNEFGHDFAGVFNLSGGRKSYSSNRISVRFVNNGLRQELKSPNGYYPVLDLLGFSDCGENYLTRNNFNPIGSSRYPTDVDEVAIPKYFAEIIVGEETFGFENINDLIGRKVSFGNNQAIRENKEFTIVGIYDTGAIDSKYDDLKDTNSSLSSLDRQKLTESLSDVLRNGFQTVFFVSEDFYEEYSKNLPESIGGNYIAGTWTKNFAIQSSPVDYDVNETYNSYLTDFSVKVYEDEFAFYDLNGNKIDYSLKNDEIFISRQEFMLPYYSRVSELLSLTMSLRGNHPEAANELNTNNGYFYIYDEATCEEAKNLIDKWHQTLYYREFIRQSFDAIVNKIYNLPEEERGDLEQVNEAIEARDRINQYRYWDNESVPAPESCWETLINFVTENLETYSPQTLYLPYLTELETVIVNKGIQEEYFKDFVLGYDFYFVKDRITYGGFSDEEFIIVKEAIETEYAKYVSTEKKDLLDFFKPNYDFEKSSEYYYKGYTGQTGTLKVKGYFSTISSCDGNYIVNKDLLRENAILEEEEYYWTQKQITDYEVPLDARYCYIISSTQNTQEQIQSLLKEEKLFSYTIQGEVFESLILFLDLITNMKKIFLILGVVFGVFAGLMLVNFISVSISAKRKDIGILRAVGARGADVFKIFFSEASIIASICFILATVGSYITCDILNGSFTDIVNMELLNFSIINVGLILVISFFVSLFATFFPVLFASKKSPVESIRAL